MMVASFRPNLNVFAMDAALTQLAETLVNEAAVQAA